MTPHEAERIINEYGAALALGTNGGVARKLSWLPCSVCKIRHAFFVYLNELISNGQLRQDVGDQLKNAYASLNHFIADADAETINEIHSETKYAGDSIAEDKRQLYSKFLGHAFRMDEHFEINSYINECFLRRDNQDWILH